MTVSYKIYGVKNPVDTGAYGILCDVWLIYGSGDGAIR